MSAKKTFVAGDPCPDAHCQGGRLFLQQENHTVMYYGRHVTLPGIEFWSCNVCGKTAGYTPRSQQAIDQAWDDLQGVNAP